MVYFIKVTEIFNFMTKIKNFEKKLNYLMKVNHLINLMIFINFVIKFVKNFELTYDFMV